MFPTDRDGENDEEEDEREEGGTKMRKRKDQSCSQMYKARFFLTFSHHMCSVPEQLVTAPEFVAMWLKIPNKPLTEDICTSESG